MAWTRKLPSDRWQALYRDSAGRVRTAGTFRRKGDAQVAGEEQESKLRRGVWLDPELSRVTVEQWAEQWLDGARPMLKPKTVASYESLLRSRVLPAFGRQPLCAIQPSDVGAWIGGMVESGVSPSRIRQAHVVLRSMLQVAVRDGYVARNAALGAKLPRLAHTEAAYFEPGEVDGIAAAVAAPYDALLTILGTCGLRYGEAVALRSKHVNVLRRRLTVESSLAEVSGRLVFGPTKSHARRSVPMSPQVTAALVRAAEGKGPEDLLFTGPKGGPLRYRYFYMKVWRPTLEALGLPAVGLHVLRHSAAARIVAAGGSAKTLQTVLGHRSAAFSLTVYGHLFDADLDALAERLDITRERKTQ